MVFYAKAIALTSLLINIAQYGPEFHTTAFQYPREWRVGEIYLTLYVTAACGQLSVSQLKLTTYAHLLWQACVWPQSGVACSESEWSRRRATHPLYSLSLDPCHIAYFVGGGVHEPS